MPVDYLFFLNNISKNVGNDVNIIHNEGRNKIYKYNGKIIDYISI